MLIGEAAAIAGVTIKAVRFYADEGLLGPVPKAGTYRAFNGRHVERLRLVSHCRSLGFSVAEIREVIAVLPEKGCPSPTAMLALVDAKLAHLAREAARLKRQIRSLTERRRYLADRRDTEVE